MAANAYLVDSCTQRPHPLVGAHILIGAVLGTGIALLFQAGLLWNHGVRLSAVAGAQSVTALLGARHVVQQFLFYLDDAISKAMTVLFLIFVFRLVVRSGGVAAALSTAILAFAAISWTPPGVAETGVRNPVVLLVIIGASVVLGVFALTRFGLLTTVTNILTLSILTGFPVTADLSSWYFGTGITALIAVLAAAAYGYHTAVAGNTWFGGLMLKESE